MMQALINTTSLRWKICKIGKQVVNRSFVFAGALAIALIAGNASANPAGGAVVAGNASISSAGKTLTVNQGSDKAVINWGSFDIGAGETTKFNQPGKGSIALNRVTNSGQASIINGNLSANGNVIVVNPNGVLIGKKGRIDAGGFVATSANISNKDFMKDGALNFNKAGNSGAVVDNQGQITVADAGVAALVAPQVKNSGVIQGNVAKVNLGAGDTFAVDLYGDGLVSLAVSDKNAKRAVNQTGTISAEGGTVLMTAAAAGAVVDGVVNSGGVVQASSLVKKGGTIILTGDKVNVSGKLNASGKKGGGTIKVGGDAAGKGSLAKAKTVTILESASLNADATHNGNGGNIVVWSDEFSDISGVLSARGGAFGGNGGTIETSSAGKLAFIGKIDALASEGLAGDWILDPANIRIVADGTPGAGNYNPATDSDATTPGDSLIEVSSIQNAGANVTLAASNDITFETSVQMANSGVGIAAVAGNDISVATQTIETDGAQVSLFAGNNLSLTDSKIDSNGGQVQLVSGNGLSILDSSIVTDGGDVLIGTSSFTMTDSDIVTAGGDVFITAGSSASVNGSIITTDDSSTNTGDIILPPSGAFAADVSNTLSRGKFGGDITIAVGGRGDLTGTGNCFSAGGTPCTPRYPGGGTPGGGGSGTPGGGGGAGGGTPPTGPGTPQPPTGPGTPQPPTGPGAGTPPTGPSFSGNFPTFFFDELGRPVISVGDQVLVFDAPFEGFEIDTLDTNVSLQGGTPGTGGTSVPVNSNFSNLSPEQLAGLTPAAGPGMTGNTGGGGGQDAGSSCGNSFLDNKPCAAQ